MFDEYHDVTRPMVKKREDVAGLIADILLLDRIEWIELEQGEFVSIRFDWIVDLEEWI
ncbi:hypothetical protein Hanom_Chr08g00712721 [Helianthus anomalus]